MIEQIIACYMPTCHENSNTTTNWHVSILLEASEILTKNQKKKKKKKILTFFSALENWSPHHMFDLSFVTTGAIMCDKRGTYWMNDINQEDPHKTLKFKFIVTIDNNLLYLW